LRNTASGAFRSRKESDGARIAVGALRYFLLKFTRNTVIAFDFKEALSFEGETGPYCQYAAVRTNSIFRKLPGETVARRIVNKQIAGDSALQARVSEVLSGEAARKSGRW
jgi:arginyl-tRNA synthetase